MLHMLAYAKSTDATVDVDITPVPDDVFLITNAHFFPKNDVQLKAAFACGTTLVRAKIVTPSLRVITAPFIRPINGANLPTTLPAVADYRENPLLLKGQEEISVLATQSGAGPTVVNVGLLVDTGATPLMPAGQIYTMRGTATDTLVANAWKTLTVTWADTLPTGTYAIVGLQVKSATGILARIIVNGQQERPGCVAQTLFADNGWNGFRKGMLGVWGYFNSSTLPLIQVLANAGDASEEIYLDIIRTA